MPAAEIQMLPSAAGHDPALVAGLTELVNQVYAVAERGLWAEGAARTTAGEMAELVAAGEIAVARVSGEIAGGVRVRRLESGEGEFGMLVSAPAHRGSGVGRELVRFAEDLSRGRGLAAMRLELLVPRDWRHPGKVFLREWYTRRGYRLAGTRDVTDGHPHLAPLLATPCDIHVYRKPLTTT
ncbi:GNAT family N-acetyltransferase [Sphaerisporangium krabiense]|uniref:GNAT superfamily N-acetyltransferase n=1 Tax=Sphaerisporangium krabiense TaxID=763782 RepID=A0A7W8ZCU0_9ACTN|nr:GNAT family N-acetyltransferase [Sphaerisporangium krabiense]MBB5631637.1 GNAT superfamily N-acetyltransferase [Sphaerisporangium krabiense]GII61053.1 GNAT family N-acetyltransferase [Sphaerisporangium krabiense]